MPPNLPGTGLTPTNKLRNPATDSRAVAVSRSSSLMDRDMNLLAYTFLFAVVAASVAVLLTSATLH